MRCTHPRRERNRARRKLIDETRERVGAVEFVSEDLQVDSRETRRASREQTGRWVSASWMDALRCPLQIDARRYGTSRVDVLLRRSVLKHLKDRSALDAFESWEVRPKAQANPYPWMKPDGSVPY